MKLSTLKESIKKTINGMEWEKQNALKREVFIDVACLDERINTANRILKDLEKVNEL